MFKYVINSKYTKVLMVEVEPETNCWRTTKKYKGKYGTAHGRLYFRVWDHYSDAVDHLEDYLSRQLHDAHARYKKAYKLWDNVRNLPRENRVKGETA